MSNLSPYTITIITKDHTQTGNNVLANAAIEIRDRLSTGASGGLSIIYEDQEGLIPITQTGATTNSLGQLSFFAAPGEYNAVYNNGTLTTIAIDVTVTKDDVDANSQAIELINEDNVARDSKISALESSDIAQGDSIEALEVSDAEQNSAIDALQLGQGSSVYGYATKALLDADLAPEDQSIAYVTNDTTATNNGTYRKDGATGAGSWVQSSDDLASQAYQLSTSNESRVEIVEYRADESGPAGVMQSDLISVDEGVLTVTEGSVSWERGATAHPVLELNGGAIIEVSFFAVANSPYLSVGNIGKASVFFGLKGGAYGRFQTSDGDGNFVNLTGDVTSSPFIGDDTKALFNGSFLEVYQRVDSSSAYTRVLSYDLDLLARPELTSENRKLGFVNKGSELQLSNVTYGNTDRYPIVSSTLDESISKDALSVKAGTLISDDVQYLAGQVPGHIVTQDEVTISGDSEISIDSVGGALITRNSTLYPTIEVSKLLTSFSFKRESLIYVLLSVNQDRSEAVILTIFGGGTGNIFKFTNGNSFALLGPAPSYNTLAPTDYIRQSLVGNNMLIEGRLSNGQYETICNYDFSVGGSDLGIKSLGGVARLDGTLFNNGFIGSDTFSQIEVGNWTGKDWAVMGDSITEQGRYVTSLQAILGIDAAQNLGLSGKTITPVDASSISEQWKSITGTPELITCWGGTNDFGQNKPIGTINDAANSATFYGGLKYIAENIVLNYPLSRFFFINILHRDWQSGGQPPGLVNNNGDTVDDFNDAIKAVGRLYSIPVIDVYQGAGVSLNNITTFTYDRLHLNDLGGQRVADYAASVIEPLKDNV